MNNSFSSGKLKNNFKDLNNNKIKNGIFNFLINQIKL